MGAIGKLRKERLCILLHPFGCFLVFQFRINQCGCRFGILKLSSYGLDKNVLGFLVNTFQNSSFPQFQYFRRFICMKLVFSEKFTSVSLLRRLSLNQLSVLRIVQSTVVISIPKTKKIQPKENLRAKLFGYRRWKHLLKLSFPKRSNTVFSNIPLLSRRGLLLIFEITKTLGLFII